MDNQMRMCAFLLASTGMFLISSLLTGLSYIAYRQSEKRSTFLVATAGFGFVVLGGLVDPVYLSVVKASYHLAREELLWLQTGEGVLITVGLGLLFYAITNHASASTGSNDDSIRLSDDGDFRYEIPGQDD